MAKKSNSKPKTTNITDNVNYDITIFRKFNRVFNDTPLEHMRNSLRTEVNDFLDMFSYALSMSQDDSDDNLSPVKIKQLLNQLIEQELDDIVENSSQNQQDSIIRKSLYHTIVDIVTTTPILLRLNPNKYEKIKYQIGYLDTSVETNKELNINKIFKLCQEEVNKHKIFTNLSNIQDFNNDVNDILSNVLKNLSSVKYTCRHLLDINGKNNIYDDVDLNLFNSSKVTWIPSTTLFNYQQTKKLFSYLNDGEVKVKYININNFHKSRTVNNSLYSSHSSHSISPDKLITPIFTDIIDKDINYRLDCLPYPNNVHQSFSSQKQEIISKYFDELEKVTSSSNEIEALSKMSVIEFSEYRVMEKYLFKTSLKNCFENNEDICNNKSSKDAKKVIHSYCKSIMGHFLLFKNNSPFSNILDDSIQFNNIQSQVDYILLFTYYIKTLRTLQIYSNSKFNDLEDWFSSTSPKNDVLKDYYKRSNVISVRDEIWSTKQNVLTLLNCISDSINEDKYLIDVKEVQTLDSIIDKFMSDDNKSKHPFLQGDTSHLNVIIDDILYLQNTSRDIKSMIQSLLLSKAVMTKKLSYDGFENLIKAFIVLSKISTQTKPLNINNFFNLPNDIHYNDTLTTLIHNVKLNDEQINTIKITFDTFNSRNTLYISDSFIFNNGTNNGQCNRLSRFTSSLWAFEFGLDVKIKYLTFLYDGTNNDINVLIPKVTKFSGGTLTSPKTTMFCNLHNMNDIDSNTLIFKNMLSYTPNKEQNDKKELLEDNTLLSDEQKKLQDFKELLLKTTNKKPSNLIIRDSQWKMLVRNCLRAKNTMIVGESGCGKTISIKELAKTLNRPLYYMNMGSTQDPRTVLLGTNQYSKEKGTHFVKSSFIKALTTPNQIILLDELSRAHPEAMNILMTVLDKEQRYIRIDETNEVINIDQTVSFFATANIGSQYTATRVLDRAIQDRFFISEVTMLNKEDNLMLLNTRFPNSPLNVMLCDIYDVIKNEYLYTDGSLSQFISTRVLLEAAQLAEDGFSIDEISCELFETLFDDDGTNDSERTFVKQIIERFNK